MTRTTKASHLQTPASIDIRLTGLGLKDHARFERGITILREHGPLTVTEFAGKLSEFEPKLVSKGIAGHILRFGWKNGVFEKKRNYVNLKGKIKHLPDGWSVNEPGLKVLTASKPPHIETLCDELTNEKKRLLDHVDWSSYRVGSHYALNLAVAISILDCSREQLTNEQIARKMCVDVSTFRKIKAELRRVRIIPKKGPAVVNWDRIRTLRTRRLSPGEVRLTDRHWNPKYKVYHLKIKRPQSTLLTKEQHRALQSVDWKQLVGEMEGQAIKVKNEHEWLKLRSVMERVGEERQVGAPDIGQEIGRSESLVRRSLNTLRGLGVVSSEKADDCGPTGARHIHRVDFSKIEQLAGVKAKPTTNGQPKAKRNGAANREPDSWSDFRSPKEWTTVFHRSWSAINRKMRNGKLPYEKADGQWLYRFPLSSLPTAERNRRFRQRKPKKLCKNSANDSGL